MSDTGKVGIGDSLPMIGLSLLSGICLLQLQADVITPFWTHSEWLMFLPLFLWLFFLNSQRRIVFAFVIGYLWALLFAHVYLQQQLPVELVGEDILIEGAVLGLPDMSGKSTRFNFKVTRYLMLKGKQSALLEAKLPSSLRLSWYYNKNNVRSGERWRLLVRLKPPHGSYNKGGFDYEKWLYQQAIHATGYVRKSHNNMRLSDAKLSIDSIRENLLLVLSKLPDSTYAGLLQALTIGLKSSITAEQWQVLRQTGTSHLMAISGLHIGLVAGLCFMLTRRLVPAYICKYLSAPQVAAIVSLIIAGFYALLAGFTVPTQRAFIMLLVVMLAILIKRSAFSLNTLALALIAVLIINPLSVLSVGFWLSFIAVLIISLVSSCRIK